MFALLVSVLLQQCICPNSSLLSQLQVKPEDNNVEQAGAGGGRQKLIQEVFYQDYWLQKSVCFICHDILVSP